MVLRQGWWHLRYEAVFLRIRQYNQESLQNENSAATPFLAEVENITGIYVENQSNFGTNGYNKPGPAVAAAPEMWNIQFIKG